MRRRRIVLCTVLSLTVGCATPPQTEVEYAEAAQHVMQASLSMEADAPATLPVEPELEGTHDVDFYVRVALERNPEILTAQRDVAAQAEVIPQATALNDPMLSNTFMPITNNSVQTAAGRGVNTLSLSQRFPWFGKLRVRGEVAEQETKIALARLAEAQLKVIERVKLSYFELYFTQQAIKITEEDATLLRNLLRFADARYRAGKTSQQDVLRAQVELEKLRDRLITLRRRLRQAQADLAKDLHASPDSDLKAEASITAEPAPEQIEQLYEAAVRCRPELQQHLHAIIRSQRIRELARLQYYPDVTLGVGWQAITDNNAISPVANGNDNLMFGVGINIPIWRDRLRAGVSEAEHRTVAAARRYDSERDDTFRQIKRLVVQADALERQVELFRKSIVPKSVQTLRISAADYRVGKVDFQQIVDNWSDLLRYQTELFRLEAMLGQTLASLERVIGCQLVTLVDGPAASGASEVPPKPMEPVPDERKPTEKTSKVQPSVSPEPIPKKTANE